MSVIVLFLAVVASVSPVAQTATSSSNFSVPVVYRKLPNGLGVVVSGGGRS